MTLAALALQSSKGLGLGGAALAADGITDGAGCARRATMLRASLVGIVA